VTVISLASLSAVVVILAIVLLIFQLVARWNGKLNFR